MTPTFDELNGAGYTSMRKTTGRTPTQRTYTVEVFRRDSDQTCWWMRSLDDDHDVVQVEPVTVNGVPTYHQLSSG